MTPTESAIAVVLGCIFIPATGFMLGYGMSMRWFSSWEGWALISGATGLSLMSGTFLARLWLWVPQWVWLPVGAVVAMGSWLKFIVFLDARFDLFTRLEARTRRPR